MGCSSYITNKFPLRPAIVDKYIGDSARVIREMFRGDEPCVIFMDEIDAIGGRR